MKKLSIAFLAGLFVLSMSAMVLAESAIKVGGVVDVILIENEAELAGVADVQNALLKINGAVNEKVSVQLAAQMAATTVSGEENPLAAENFVSVKLGNGELKAGNYLLPSLHTRNSLANNNATPVAGKFSGAMDQVAYNGDAGMLKYIVALHPGTNDKDGPTNDLGIKLSAETAGLTIDVLADIDTVTKNAADNDLKEGYYGLGLGYNVAGASINFEFLSFEKMNEFLDATKEVSSEIIIGVGYKISDATDVGIAYDMLGKSSNIVITANQDLGGAKLKLRVDAPGSDYAKLQKDVAGKDDKPTIALGLGAEF